MHTPFGSGARRSTGPSVHARRSVLLHAPGASFSNAAGALAAAGLSGASRRGKGMSAGEALHVHLDYEAGRRRLGGRRTGFLWRLVVRLDLAGRVEQHQACGRDVDISCNLHQATPAALSSNGGTEVAVDAGVALQLEAANPFGCAGTMLHRPWLPAQHLLPTAPHVDAAEAAPMCML